MFKRLALGLVIIIITFGIILLVLDVLDIEENLKLLLPVSILNIIFIFIIAVIVAYIAARCFTMADLPETFWLGGAVLMFAIGSMFRVWLSQLSGNTIITVENSTAFFASLLHLIGASIGLIKKRRFDLKIMLRLSIILLYYLGVFATIALVTWLAIQGVTPSFMIPNQGVTALGENILTITTIFFLASSVINFGIYTKLHTDFYYWYSQGLMLFAFGILFMSEGNADTMIASLGRVSQYAGGIYFLVSVLGAYRQADTGKIEVISD